ncbi:hypothetical protein GCM10027398_36940 [Azotobacter salinestris]
MLSGEAAVAFSSMEEAPAPGDHGQTFAVFPGRQRECPLRATAFGFHHPDATGPSRPVASFTGDRKWTQDK